MPLDLVGSVWDRFGSDLVTVEFGMDRVGIWSGPEIFIWGKFSTFTSTLVFEHAHIFVLQTSLKRVRICCAKLGV